MKFVEARHYRKGRAGKVHFLVVHDMEMHETATTAEDCAHMFATMTREASAHFCIDDDSIVQCVKTSDTAWAAGSHGNMWGIHYEIAGFAAQTRAGWSDVYSSKALVIAAKRMAVDAEKYGIPAKFIDREQLKAGARGITTHREISFAWHDSTHEDPGPDFPMAVFVVLVSQEIRALRKAKSLRTAKVLAAALVAAGLTATQAGRFVSHSTVAPEPAPSPTVTATATATPKPTPSKRPTATLRCSISRGDTGAKVRKLQREVGAKVDGDFGPSTLAKLKAWQRKHPKAGSADGVAGSKFVAAARADKTSTYVWSYVRCTR